MNLTKKIILLIFICIFSLNLLSQVDYEGEQVSGFASFDISTRIISGKAAMLMGGSCGIIVRDIRIGAFVQGVSSKFKFKDINEEPRSLSCMQGGLSIGYTMLKRGNFRPIADLRLSFGQASTIDTDFNRENKMFFWGVIPRLGLGYKFSDIFMLEIGADYQYSILYEPPPIYDKKLLNSLGFYLSLKLGNF